MVFKVIFTSIVFFFTSYICYGILLPINSILTKISFITLILLLDLTILWVPFLYWNQESNRTTEFQRKLLWIAFTGIGFLSNLFIIILFRDLLNWVLPIQLISASSSLLIILTSLIGVFIGVTNASNKSAVRSIEIYFNNIPPNLDGFKILQISDLHVGPTIRKEFVLKVVEQINSKNADIIVFTGDAIDGMVEDLSSECEPLRLLKSKYGKFYCTGNHEYYWDAPGWIKKFESLGFITLQNETTSIQIDKMTVSISGVNDPAAAIIKQPGPDFKSACPIQNADFKLLLCHQPKFADEASKFGFDLQLSGHTHGGQFFPWTLVTNWIHKYNYGLHLVQAMKIYVSRGTGYWGPPVRLGSPSEISEIIIRKLN